MLACGEEWNSREDGQSEYCRDSPGGWPRAATGAVLTMIKVSSFSRRRGMRQDFDRLTKLQIVLPAKVFGVLDILHRLRLQA